MIDQSRVEDAIFYSKRMWVLKGSDQRLVYCYVANSTSAVTNLLAHRWDYEQYFFLREAYVSKFTAIIFHT